MFSLNVAKSPARRVRPGPQEMDFRTAVKVEREVRALMRDTRKRERVATIVEQAADELKALHAATRGADRAADRLWTLRSKKRQRVLAKAHAKAEAEARSKAAGAKAEAKAEPTAEPKAEPKAAPVASV